MAGFEYRKNLNGSSDNPVTLEVLAKDSITFTVGDAVRINTSGTVDVVDAGEGIGGICVGMVDAKGKALTPDSGTLNDYTMDSDNTTAAAKKYKVVFIPALSHYLFYNDSSGTLAQTNLFQYFDLADLDQVDQSSATDTATKQVRLIEIDPDHDGDASKGLFQIVESQFAQIGTTTAA